MKRNTGWIRTYYNSTLFFTPTTPVVNGLAHDGTVVCRTLTDMPGFQLCYGLRNEERRNETQRQDGRDTGQSS